MSPLWLSDRTRDREPGRWMVTALPDDRELLRWDWRCWCCWCGLTKAAEAWLASNGLAAAETRVPVCMVSSPNPPDYQRAFDSPVPGIALGLSYSLLGPADLLSGCGIAAGQQCVRRFMRRADRRTQPTRGSVLDALLPKSSVLALLAQHGGVVPDRHGVRQPGGYRLSSSSTAAAVQLRSKA